MSDVLHRTAAAGEPSIETDPIPTPTVTHYQQVATQVSAALSEALSLIASFEAPHTSTAGFVRTHKTVPVEFISTAIAVVESTPELQSVKKFDVNEARDVLQFIEAFRPVVDLIDSLARDLKFTVDTRKAKVAADALQIYDIAKGVARDPNSASLQTHLLNLKRDLGRTRSKPRVKAAPAA
jgi:hypothetical protein